MNGIEQMLQNMRAFRLLSAETIIPGSDKAGAVLRGAPRDVKEWYAAHDGIAYVEGQLTDDAYVIPGWTLLSIEEAEQIREEEADMFGACPWIPILSDMGGEYYVAAWKEGDLLARVVRLSDGNETLAAAPSIETFLERINACFREGAFYMDENGFFDMDDLKCAQLGWK